MKHSKYLIENPMSRFFIILLVAGFLLASIFILSPPGERAMAREGNQEVLIERIYGQDRYETAVEVSREGWDTAPGVVLANGRDFPDALAGAPLAYQENSPILLTPRDKLEEVTREEIRRLEAERVIILGGGEAISPRVEEEVRELGLQVERIGGEDRYETAMLIAYRLEGAERAVIASGEDFPDALALAPYAAKGGYPILLTRKDQLPPPSEEALNALNIGETLIGGGGAVVGEEVEEQLPSPLRLEGRDRYETAVEITRHFGLPPGRAYLVRGTDFADALAGSVLAAREQVPLLLVRQVSLPSPVKTYFEEEPFNHFLLLGGTRALSFALEWELMGNPAQIPEDYREDRVVSLLKKGFDEVREVLGEPQEEGYDGIFGGVDYLHYQEEGLFIMSPHFPVEGLEEETVNAILMGEGSEIFNVKVGMTFAEIEGILGPPHEGPSLDEATRDYHSTWYAFGERDNRFYEFELFFSARSPESPTFEAFLTWNYAAHPLDQ